MARGRKPIPTNIKLLNGNPGKRPMPANEPKPAPVIKIPDCPEWVNDEGRKIWDELAPRLERIGLLTEVDLYTFAFGCNAGGKHIQMEKEIKEYGVSCIHTNKGGNDNEVKRPQVAVSDKSFEQFFKMVVEFGLSPSARNKIEIKTESVDDPMEALLSGVK